MSDQPPALATDPDLSAESAREDPEVADIRSRATRARHAISNTPRPPASGLWLLLSLVLYFAAGAGRHAIRDVAISLLVIFLHEAGHAIAMRVFGYRDLRIFFVPFFGGAASGRKTGAPVWQQAIVLFAGPVPGLIFGIAATVVWSKTGSDLARSLAAAFLFVNGFNLAPFVPLDGGRLFAIAVFARHWLLEMGFSLLGAAALGAIAVGLRSFGLGLVALLTLSTIPAVSRVRRATDHLRAQLGTLPSSPEVLSDKALAALDRSAEAFAADPASPRRAATIRTFWERLAVAPPRGFATAAILIAWFLGVFVFFLGLVAYSVVQRRTPIEDPAQLGAVLLP